MAERFHVKNSRARERGIERAKPSLICLGKVSKADSSTVNSRSSADERELTVQPWRGPAMVGVFHVETVKLTNAGNHTDSRRAKFTRAFSRGPARRHNIASWS